MKITGIDLHVLLIPDYDAQACSSAQDDLVVEIRTDEGIVGIGETDTNPWVARECIRARGTHCMGLGLAGDAPRRRPDAARASLGDALPRLEDDGPARGADLCPGGDRHGPVGHQGQGARRAALSPVRRGAPRQVTPYASLLPTGRTLAEYRDSLVEKTLRARDLGFRAAKLEVCVNGPYSHNGLQESDDAVVEIVADCREAVGSEMVLMVDVAYAWPDAADGPRRPGAARPVRPRTSSRPRSTSTTSKATPSCTAGRRSGSRRGSGRTRISSSSTWPTAA